jgi:dolichyl-phosphate-mannose-protein mannosyltransferase
MADTHPGDATLPISTRSRVWLLGALTLVFLRALPNLSFPIARDQGTYCFIGEQLLHGKHLYLDLWDNKPPGIFYIYAVIVKLFGTAMWSVAVVDLVWLLVISYCIYKFAERHLGTGAAFIAVLFHAAWRAQAGYWDAAQTENFLMLCVFGAYFLVSAPRRSAWVANGLSGLLFGAAFWLKYNAVAFIPLLTIVPYLDYAPLDAGSVRPRLTIPRRDWLKRVIAWGVGFAVAILTVLAYFWWTGAWPAMKEIQFEVLPRYNAMRLGWMVHYWRQALWMTDFQLGRWTELAALAAVLVAWKLKALSSLSPVALAAGMGCLAVAMQTPLPSFAFETCYPFLAMLWGFLGMQIFEGARALAKMCAARGWRLAVVLVWLGFANVVYLPLPQEALSLRVHYKDLSEWWRDPEGFYANYSWARPISHYDGQWKVIEYLRAHSSPGDGVFVWGSEPLIYFQARRNPPTRFVSNLALISLWTPPAWREELIRDLAKSPPRFIMVARDDRVPTISFNYLDSEGYLQRFPALAKFIANYYQKAVDLRSFVIYRHG